jgi:hypothetical protein
MKVMKISREGLGGYFEKSIKSAVEELRENWENCDTEPLIFEIVEMSEEEYDNLPEFQGW